MGCYLFMMVRINDRDHTAVHVQEILTEYGCCVRMRLGLHDEGTNNVCMPSGVLILQLCTEKAKAKELETKLNAVENVSAQLVDLA